MRVAYCTAALVLSLFASARAASAQAQALATATQPLELSVFGGRTGEWTGFDQGKSLAFTAGVDLRILSYHHFLPSLEVRGTEPFDAGLIDAQKNALAGLKVERIYGRAHPYGDVLFGRGEIDYQGIGYTDLQHGVRYLETNSNVYSIGGGVDYDFIPHFALKGDFQIQHYDTPITSFSSIYSKDLTLGVVYHIDFNHHLKKQSKTASQYR